MKMFLGSAATPQAQQKFYIFSFLFGIFLEFVFCIPFASSKPYCHLMLPRLLTQQFFILNLLNHSETEWNQKKIWTKVQGKTECENILEEITFFSFFFQKKTNSYIQRATIQYKRHTASKLKLSNKMRCTICPHQVLSFNMFENQWNKRVYLSILFHFLVFHVA